MSFLGQDWSWGNFKNKGKGLLSDPSGLTSNPWFNMGMGILGENRKPFGGDPFGAAMGGLMSAKQTKEANEDRKRKEEARKAMKEYFDRMNTAAQQQGIQGIIDPMQPQGTFAPPQPGQPQTPEQQRMYWQMILNGQIPGGPMYG